MDKGILQKILEIVWFLLIFTSPLTLSECNSIVMQVHTWLNKEMCFSRNQITTEILRDFPRPMQFLLQGIIIKICQNLLIGTKIITLVQDYSLVIDHSLISNLITWWVEWDRKIEETIWVSTMLNQVQSFKDKTHIIIIIKK